MQIEGGGHIVIQDTVINVTVVSVWKYKSCSLCLFFWLKILPG